MPELVTIQALTKTYGDFTAVSALDLGVQAGEIFALLGPNGAGKTTTIRMLMGILQPTAGQAHIAGLDCFRDRARVMEQVGYLPDEPAFYDYLRGRELLAFVGEMHGLSAVEAQSRWQPYVEQLELADALEEYAANYSKGMRKKLALIAALLHRPALLILDEPTNGLDPFATRTLHEMLRDLAADGVGIFYSTHLLDQAERLCDRVGILSKGRMAACGPIQELRQQLSAGGTLEDVFFQVARSEAPESETPESEAPEREAPEREAPEREPAKNPTPRPPQE